MADSPETRQQELARLLLQKARQDLDLVVNVVDSDTVADEIVGFHIQQAIEKAIKSANAIIEIPPQSAPEFNDNNHP